MSALGDRLGLTILCAGCSDDERGFAESEVRRALEDRPKAEAWRVSVVRSPEHWAVTLDGPGIRTLNFKAPLERLADEIRDAVHGPAAHAPPASAGPAFGPSTTASQKDRHDCGHCGRSFLVTYEAAPDEARIEAPVACPHCWMVNRVPIAEGAAAWLEYKSEVA